MYRTSLIWLTAIFMTVTAANVNAQDITPDKYSFGPAIELGGGSTSFGIQGKVNVYKNFSIRPIILFGYGHKEVVGRTFLVGDTTYNFSGTAYGLGITYDFAFPNSQISGYAGPRILFASDSRQGANSNLTNIGLVAGADYKISQNFTVGLNIIYNVSASGSYSVPTPSSRYVDSFSDSGDFRFGINAGYNF